MIFVKGIGAVIAGFVAIVVLAGGTDTLLESTGVYPPNREAYTTWMFLLSICYRTVYSAIGGFLIAKLAPRKPMTHVFILGVLGTLIGIAGVVAGRDLPGYPPWYAISLAMLTFPTIWIGGKLAMPIIAKENDAP